MNEPSTRCPSCGEQATGNFCQSCGASLGGQFCNQCGAKLAAGAKFCSECGAGVGAGVGAGATAASATTPPAQPAGAGPPRKAAAAEVVGGQNLPWWIAGAAMFAMIFMIGLSMVRPGGPAAPVAGSGTTTAAPGTPPDISNMTPVEAADRLFNRVMASVEQGDEAAARQFLPMAVAAHQRAEPLDLDRRFHLSWLNRLAGNFEAALADAVDILDESPDHLLGLVSAAEASIELGEMDAAAGYYEHLLEVYDAEFAKPLEEYDIHRNIVISLKADAERFLEGR